MAKIIPELQNDNDSKVYTLIRPDRTVYTLTLLQLKARLYFLTRQFVYKHQRHYYIQFQGDLNDLASEFFVDFCTRKSRTPGQEQNLIDKYDSSVTSFEYLVKQAVIRKLIDCSRQDSYRKVSIDKFQSEYGDAIAQTFGLVSKEDQTVDSREFSDIEVYQAISSLEDMEPRLQKHWYRQFLECRLVLAESYRLLFDDAFRAIGFAIPE